MVTGFVKSLVKHSGACSSALDGNARLTSPSHQLESLTCHLPIFAFPFQMLPTGSSFGQCLVKTTVPYLGVSAGFDAHMETRHARRRRVWPQVDDDSSRRVEPLQRALRAA